MVMASPKVRFPRRGAIRAGSPRPSTPRGAPRARRSLGLQHLEARLERADRIGQIAGRDVAQPFGFGVQLLGHWFQATLADAVGAERIASGEAAALRAELDRRREWRLLRRLRWALRGDRSS